MSTPTPTPELLRLAPPKEPLLLAPPRVEEYGLPPLWQLMREYLAQSVERKAKRLLAAYGVFDGGDEFTTQTPKEVTDGGDDGHDQPRDCSP